MALAGTLLAEPCAQVARAVAQGVEAAAPSSRAQAQGTYEEVMVAVVVGQPNQVEALEVVVAMALVQAAAQEEAWAQHSEDA